MTRVAPILALLYVAVVVFAIVDIITIAEGRVKVMPKWGWAIVVLLFPIVGVVLWFLAGRERAGTPRSAQRRAPRAPDDDPEFLGKLARDREQEERIRKLEERLRELGDDDQRPTG